MVRGDGRIRLLVQNWQLCRLLPRTLHVGKQRMLGKCLVSLLVVRWSVVPSMVPFVSELLRRCMGSMARTILSLLSGFVTRLVKVAMTLLMFSSCCANLVVGWWR